MSPPLLIKVSRRATAQIEKAAEWWRDNRPAAPGAIREDVARALLLLSTQPGIGVRARNARSKNVRRLTLSRVGYYLHRSTRYGTSPVVARERDERLSFLYSPEFDPKLPAFYYARVLEIPTPRWLLHDKVRYDLKDLPAKAQLVQQERVVTSPVWYDPK